MFSWQTRSWIHGILTTEILCEYKLLKNPNYKPSPAQGGAKEFFTKPRGGEDAPHLGCLTKARLV